MRDGEKGPLVTQVAWTLVQAKTEGKVSDVAESLLVFREQQSDGSWKHDYLLSNEIASEPAGGDGVGVQGGAPDRGVPEAGQGRGGAGGLSGEDVGGLAPPRVPVVAGDLVPERGSQARESRQRDLATCRS